MISRKSGHVLFKQNAHVPNETVQHYFPKHIERHPINLPRFEKIYHDSVKEFHDFLASARERPSSLTLLLSTCSTVFSCGSVLTTAPPEIGQALRVAAQASAALFAMANAKGEPVSVPLGAEPAKYASPKPDESSTNAGRWLQGYLYATICRDKASLKLLCSTPLATLRASSTKSPEYKYLLVDALQSWHRGQEDVANRFIAAMDATDPHRPDIADSDYTLRIDVPMITCLLYAAAAQPDFGEKLANGVASHKKFWTLTEDLSEDWDGFLSIPLLAAAALAFDGHLSFEVDSAYLPMRLVKGEF